MAGTAAVEAPLQQKPQLKCSMGGCKLRYHGWIGIGPSATSIDSTHQGTQQSSTASGVGQPLLLLSRPGEQRGKPLLSIASNSSSSNLLVHENIGLSISHFMDVAVTLGSSILRFAGPYGSQR